MCEDELVCDLAEIYHVFNWQELPPTLVATLAFGLPADSRTKKKLTGQKLTLTEQLLALIVDDVRRSNWMRTKDGYKGRNQPESIYERLMGINQKTNDDLMSMTIDEFDAWYKAKMKRKNNG